MARYINLDELLNAIDKRNGRLPLWLDEILMEDCKIADVTPVRHGYWIEQCEESLYSCSVCSTEWVTIEGTPEENGMDFCPHCGAKMDEKDRDENA